MPLRAADHRLLLTLLDLPTAGPLESPGPVRLWEAQHVYAEAAAGVGFEVVHHAPASPADLDRPDVPHLVRSALANPGFLTSQPSLVLRLGPELPRARTVMFNVHLDTVAGYEPVSFDGETFHGRGAIDAKGPAVALLAGIRDARLDGIGVDGAGVDGISVLVQVVAGEEGGAMGVFGTRPLVERGYVGALNVFCEPTGLHYLPRCTASATARVRITGDGAIDDRPGDGHNATVLLGHLAAWLGTALSGTGACVAGLHTGHLHNRVYGTGDLLINLPYATPADGAHLTKAVTDAVQSGIAAFTARYATVPELARTAADAPRLTTVDWLKRDLPTLTETGTDLAALMHAAGIPRWPDTTPSFTCDAIWLSGVPGTTTAVLGPGDLSANNAHAPNEFAALSTLNAFATMVKNILTTFRESPVQTHEFHVQTHEFPVQTREFPSPARESHVQNVGGPR